MSSEPKLVHDVLVLAGLHSSVQAGWEVSQNHLYRQAGRCLKKLDAHVWHCLRVSQSRASIHPVPQHSHAVTTKICQMLRTLWYSPHVELQTGLAAITCHWMIMFYDTNM